MRWGLEVQMAIAGKFDPTTGAPVREWRDVRPTGGQPYRYETRHEAEAMLRICYPDQTRDQARTKEIV